MVQLLLAVKTFKKGPFRGAGEQQEVSLPSKNLTQSRQLVCSFHTICDSYKGISDTGVSVCPVSVFNVCTAFPSMPFWGPTKG